LCSNAPRTFLNADSCVLSSVPYACGSTTAQAGILIDISEKSILDLSALSGRYLYAVAGLPVVDVDGRKIAHPCTVGYRSRWEVQAGKTCARCRDVFFVSERDLCVCVCASSSSWGLLFLFFVFCV
jgi:hypothetical protein